MLRESSQTFGYEVNLRAVTDRTAEPGIPGGTLLLSFADAALERQAELPELRDRLIAEFGPEATVEAAGVIGNFSMMNRIADATGMPMGTGAMEASVEIRRNLDLDRFLHD